ncbi:uncharacterized protein [Choristoneura fumiferana]|uniref:uncharacterized protein n=1 Tax=Choristoneura fumiferana TaxID=7141 RepID=UPI003D15DA3E
MERLTISKLEKQTIYEIYRACRICGAGGGYRMPIIQNIVALDTSDVELVQKIQECLQLEVRSDDRMPPLICELCVDKVNDYYEFLKQSRQTNIRTRTRLGLPLQTVKKSEPVQSSPGDCTLGDKALACVDKPAPKKSKAGPKCSKKEEDNVNVEEPPVPSPAESRASSVSSRSSRTARRAPTPPRPVRVLKSATKTTPIMLGNKKVAEKEQEKGTESNDFIKAVRGLGKELHDLIQDNQKYDENSLLVPRSMKRKETEPPRPGIIPKRTRATLKEPVKELVKEPSPPRYKPGPKSRQAPREDPKSRTAPKEDPKSRLAPREDPKSRTAPKEDPKSRLALRDPKSLQGAKEDPKSRQAPKEDPKIPVPLKILKSKSKLNVVSTPPKVEEPPPKTTPHCTICDTPFKSHSGLSNHLKTHLVTYTKLCQACNPCGKWFVTTEEAATHHRYHRAATFPYHCRRCFEDYKTLPDYDSHISNGLCMPYDLIPDVKCERCWKTFITSTLMDAHRCQGVDGRPGGNCSKCSRGYLTQRTLKAHQKTCTYKKPAGGLIADPDVLRRLKPMQVRIARCDDLLARTGGRVDASTVKPNHGLDKNYLYPYIRFKSVKPKPLRRILAARGPIRDKPERDRYTHWDSDDSDSNSIIKTVDSLSTLCLKKIFSKNMLGKVPRKKRKEEIDAFDSVNDFSIDSDINNIISSLNDDLNNDCVRRNRKDSLIAIAINDIIGVPNFVPNFKLGNDNVARSSNDVHINDKNESNSNVIAGNESLNEIDKLKDLNDVEIENEGTDTVVSASDISTELHLIESESRDNTRNEAVCERMGDNMETNDTETKNDLDDKNKDENVEINNDEIRNFTSVDGKNNDDHFKDCNETNVQNNHLSTEEDYKYAELNHSENNIDDLDNQDKSDNMQQSSNNGNAITNNDSEVSNDNLGTKNRYENTDINYDLETQNSKHENQNINDLDNSHKSDNVQQNSNNDNVVTNNDSEISNENLESKNNHENIVMNDDLATQNNKHENVNPDHSKILNDNLSIDDDPVINNSETQNENDVQQNSETDTQNDNFNISHKDIKNDDINSHLDNLNEDLNAVNLNSETNTHSDCINSNVDTKYNENTQLHRIEDETKNWDVSKNVLEEPSFEAQNSPEKELQNSAVNGITTSDNFGESIKETKKITNESPIKHSIENLIGDTDKNPDKYIDEVISSIEDIINKNSRNEDTNDHLTNGEHSNQMDDRMLMDALDTHIGEGKEKTDNEKITLDDLLPKNNTPMELDDISDDDFNFDA